MLRHAVLASLALAGCTSVAAITPNICGNDVLEPGEDCDQPGGACTSSCRIACDPAMRATSCAGDIDGSCCPSGSTCGLDRVCHAPSGTLSSEQASAAFDVTAFRVGDIDGDMIDDVIGASTSSVSALYGSTDMPFANGTSLVAAFSTGTLAIGDFTGDGRLDVLIPTTGGLAAYTTTTGTLQPISFPTNVVPNTTPVRLGTVGSGATAQVVSLLFVYSPASQSGNTVLVQNGTAVPLCGKVVGPTTIQGRSLHPYLDGTVTRVPVEFIDAATTGSPLTVCIQNAENAADYTIVIPPMSAEPAGDGEVETMPLLGGICPDLVIPYQAPSDGFLRTQVLAGTGITGTCGFDTSNPVVVQGMSLAYTQILVGGTLEDSLVTSAGIYTISLTTHKASQLVQAPRQWRYAVVADLDGNMLPDIVTLGTTQDVEVLLQVLVPPSVSNAQWSDLRIPTSQTTTLVAIGNYDGDASLDLAIATLDPVLSNTEDLFVAWGGASGGFSALTPVATFPEFTQMVEFPLNDTSVPPGFDHSDDLVIGRGGADPTDANDPGEIVDVFGAADRELSAPEQYSSTFGSNGLPVRAIGAAAVIGRFGASGGALVPGAIALFTGSPNGTNNNAAANVLTYQSYGDFTVDTSREYAFQQCDRLAQNGRSFCAATGRYATIARDDGDLVIGLQPTEADVGDAACLVYYQASATDIARPQFAACSDLGLVNASGLRVLDDGGTSATIEVSHEMPAAMQDTLDLYTVTMAAGSPVFTKLPDLSTEVSNAVYGVPNLVQCEAASEAELGTRPDPAGGVAGAGLEIVVVCHVPVTQTSTSDTVRIFARYASASNPAAPVYEQLVDLQQDEQVRLQSGDINGDGLDDLVFVAGQRAFAIAQCDLHGACGPGAL